ncbi:MAG: enoyl-CoA hydratase/isomerase family protein [Phycisphaerales bacterium]
MPLATLTIADRVATLALNRPDARNALSPDLLADLRARVQDLARLCEDPDASPRVCVLTGEGKSFCAGMDLRAVLDDPREASKLLHALADLTLLIRNLPIPSIARVNGAAIGGGCGLTCVCDFAVTHDDAKLGYPEVDLGVCPAVVAPWLMLRLGPAQARRVLLEGGTMSGARAAQLGLVTRSVPNLTDLDSAVHELTSRLVSAGPAALRATKAWLNSLDPTPSSVTLRRGADISAEVVAGPEAQANLRAKFASR